MKRKIKLTDKDLEIKVTSYHEVTSCSEQADTKYPDCPTTTLGLNCQTATFRTVCLSKDPTCDCGNPVTDRLECYDTGNNCIEPYTQGVSCEGCISYDCPQPGTGDIVCESNDCVVSNECEETFPCAISEIDCDRISELANCETTAIKCTQVQ